MSRKKIIIITVAFFALVGLLILIGYLTTPKKPDVKTFSENFIRDFSTYQMTDTQGYNEKLNKYIYPNNLSDFSDKFFLPKQNFVPAVEKNNFSEYKSSNIDVVKEDSKGATVDIKYTVKKKDAPGRPNEFTEITNGTIVLIKENNGLFITNFTFSVPE